MDQNRRQQEMEDKKNGRQPNGRQQKWKTTTMEDIQN